MPEPNNKIAAAIIPAAGSGSRMGTAQPKQFTAINGTPVLVLTLSPFLSVGDIHSIIVTVPQEYQETAASIIRAFFPSSQRQRIFLVPGGATRQESVKAGLMALPAQTEIVLVHDGARPFVTPEIIRRCLDEAQRKGAAIAAVKIHDTIKQVTGTGTIRHTVDRNDLWHAQTPQAAQVNLLRRAYDLAEQNNFSGTDEASLLEHAGIPVAIVEGSELNFKITRPDDLILAAGLTKGAMNMKIGHGFDAHKFKSGRQLILGGVTIPFDRGLEGHSDADTLIHALIDALLGAMGEGDIGRRFPDNDPQYKDISSLTLLANVIALATEKKMALANTDITIICQYPKLAPHVEEMQHKIASTCACAPDAVNIKATTTEMMGFTGRGEGIAVHAVVLMKMTAQT